ncbi:PPE family protein, SVP subgroup, partial [Mycolicibacter virginiensis]
MGRAASIGALSVPPA